jgi:hypothetical protein
LLLEFGEPVGRSLRRSRLQYPLTVPDQLSQILAPPSIATMSAAPAGCGLAL